jgi:hypothetical protein
MYVAGGSLYDVASLPFFLTLFPTQRINSTIQMPALQKPLIGEETVLISSGVLK